MQAPPTNAPNDVSFEAFIAPPAAPEAQAAPEPVQSTPAIQAAPEQAVIEQAAAKAVQATEAKAPATEPGIDDLLGDVESFLGDKSAEEPTFTPSPVADFRWKQALAEAHGDSAKAGYLLAEYYEKSLEEAKAANEAVVGATAALEEVYPEVQITDELSGKMRWELESELNARFNQSLEKRVLALTQTPGSPYQGEEASTVRDALRVLHRSGLSEEIESRLPVALENYVNAEKKFRQEKIGKFQEAKEQKVKSFREELRASGQKLQSRLDALKPAIGDDPLLEKLALFELDKSDGPADDRERLAAARKTASEIVARSLTPEAYKANEGIRDAARKMALQDPYVRGKITERINKVASERVAAELAKHGIKAGVSVVKLATGEPGGNGNGSTNFGARPENAHTRADVTFEDMFGQR